MKVYALIVSIFVIANAGVSLWGQGANLASPSATSTSALGKADAQTEQTVASSSDAQVSAITNADESQLSFGAQDSNSTTVQQKSTGSSTLVYAIRMFVVLALVLGLIYVLFRFFKRMQAPKGQTDSPIKILASSSLGVGRAVHVVALGGKAYMLGATEGGVTLITEVTEKEVIDDLILKSELAPQPKTPAGGFQEILSSLLSVKIKPMTKKQGQQAVDPLDAEFLARQRSRLRNL